MPPKPDLLKNDSKKLAPNPNLPPLASKKNLPPVSNKPPAFGQANDGRRY
jgi:hypothetical protein